MSDFASVARPLRDTSILSRRILRCRDGQAEAVSAILRLELPRAPYGSRSFGGLHLLWLGPDEWLILAEDEARDRLSQSAERLAAAGAAFVDVSHRQVGILVKDRDVEAWLASGCPLDLTMRAFPVGACTRTLYHKAEIVLWRTGSDAFQLEVWRSFAPYVEALLTEAGCDGLSVNTADRTAEA
jgi:sarcosine oxidase subunit gamma